MTAQITTNFTATIDPHAAVNPSPTYQRPVTPDEIYGDGYTFTWSRLDIEDANTYGIHPPTGFAYTTRTLTASQSGYYTITVDSATGFLSSAYPDQITRSDTELWLYSAAFNPLNPVTNAIAVNNDISHDVDVIETYGNLLSKLDNVYLAAGATYVLVLTSAVAGASGTANLSVSGGGTVTVVDPSSNAVPTLGAVSAPNVGQGSAGAASYSFTVAYADSDGSINAGSIGIGDVVVSKGATTLSVTGASWNGTTHLATYTVTPPGGTWNEADNGTYTIALAAGAVLDDRGAPVAASANAGAFQVAIDSTAPTASIVVADSSLTVGETSQVAITFSEAVSGFTNADLTVGGGTLSAVATADGGVTWNATFTPTSNLTSASNLITLANSGVTDAAGNAGSGSTNSNNYAIDTYRPTANLTLSRNFLTVGDTAQLTITFSEVVTGFTNADLTVQNGSLSAVTSSDGRIWHATFTPAAELQAFNNYITLNRAGVADLAGNAGLGLVNSMPYHLDTQRPTATIVMEHASLAAGESSLLTITFSEPVDYVTNDALTVAHGTLTILESADDFMGMIWNAIYTPDADVTDTTNVITLDNTIISDGFGNSGAGTTISNNFAIDTQRPTATISFADAALTAGETSQVTIAFSEAVTGFTNAGLSVANGTLGAVSSTDGGVTWTATFTPSAGVTDATNVITLANSGVADLAGNPGSGSTDSNNYTINTQRPTAAIAMSDVFLGVGETADVTITFSEAVTGFTSADLSATNGALGAVSSADGGVTWLATFTPTAGVRVFTNAITLDMTGVANSAGNAGVGTAVSPLYYIDGQRPAATIAMADSSLTIGESSLVTITFSKYISGFTNEDLTVANGTLSAVTSPDEGRTWTATFTPNAAIADTTNVITLNNAGVSDGFGNAGAGSTDSNNYAVDTLRPTAAITVHDSTLAAGETTQVTIAFSEAVTGFTSADLTVANGTLRALASTDGGATWSATLTPTANITDSANLITLDTSGVADLAGNAGVGAAVSNNYALDTQRPTATIALSDTVLAAGETSQITITFSEAVTGFTNADLTVSNGAIGALSSGDGGVTWTATFTPGAGITDATNLLTLDNSGVADLAGNAGSGATLSNNYAIDTQLPTSTIALSDTSVIAGETLQVTITFSEAVTGVTASDLTVSNGTLGALSSADGGVTWTATFTPTEGVTANSNVITLDNAGVSDSFGNAGAGAARSNNFAIDTQGPTAAIVLTDTALKIGETSQVTITFSEAVTGFNNADLTVENGSLGTVSSTDGGVTWIATFTPAAGTNDATNAITLNHNGVADLAGNAGSGSTISNNYAIDNVRPTATITVGSALLGIGATAAVTIAFSEAVTGFGNDDLVVDYGTLSALSSNDGGRTWTATLTPSADIRADDNTIRLHTSGVTDAAGNAGDTLASSNAYAVATLKVVTIDGVTATTHDITDAGTGLVNNVIDIAAVDAGRTEDVTTPNATLADIALGVATPLGGASSSLTVSLPSGAGLQAQGPAALLTNEQAVVDLLRRIESKTPAGTAQAEMTARGAHFLDSLDSGAKLETKTLVLSTGADAPSHSIEIGGSAAIGHTAVGLVIDATQLAAGTVLQLNNVEFAAVVGAATLRGGDGANFVTGDDAAQSIYLGADDDELHGGGGNDTMGSAGGNDLIDGGSGDDIVIGGIGNDTLFGGSGDDRLAGGRSDVGQWKFFVDGSGQLSARHETAVFTPGSWETVAAGELDAHAGSLGFIDAAPAKLEDLALLYHAAFQRTADLPGLEFWAKNGGTPAEMMDLFMHSAEYQSGALVQLDDAAFVRSLYTNVLGRAADDAGLQFWTGQLGGAEPVSRGQVLTAFALNPEHKALLLSADGIAVGGAAIGQQAQWFTASGNDRLDGGAGNDTLIGGDGTDTVVYGGALAEYHFVQGHDGAIHIVDSANGDTDTLSGVELGAFGDGTVDIGFTQAAASELQSLGLMYHSLLNRAADLGGLSWWVERHADTLQVAQAMTTSDEFKARFDGLDDAGFVNALYANTGLQASAAGGVQQWVDFLHTHTRAEAITEWVGAAEVVGVQYGVDGLVLV